METHDLTNGWFANIEDGALTLRNPDRGQRISLTADETHRLRKIMACWDEQEAEIDAAASAFEARAHREMSESVSAYGDDETKPFND